MRSVPVAMRMLRRNWSAGELRVLLLALLIAVGSVTTVGFFADRVQAALDQQANELLGADLVVIADHRLGPVFGEELNDLEAAFIRAGARARRLESRSRFALRAAWILVALLEREQSGKGRKQAQAIGHGEISSFSGSELDDLPLNRQTPAV